MRSTVEPEETNVKKPSLHRPPVPATMSVSSNPPEAYSPAHTASQNQSAVTSTCRPCHSVTCPFDVSHRATQARGGHSETRTYSKRLGSPRRATAAGLALMPSPLVLTSPF